jgi:hypothetical protein
MFNKKYIFLKNISFVVGILGLCISFIDLSTSTVEISSRPHVASFKIYSAERKLPF